MVTRAELESRLARFLERRGCPGLLGELLCEADRLAVGNCFYSYLPAVTYVVLRDLHGMRLSPAEVTCEGLGSARFKFIQRARQALGVERAERAAEDGAIEETIGSICRALSLAAQVRDEAGRLNASIPPGRRAGVRELFYYCASLVYLASSRDGRLRSKRELARALDISPNLVRKYERFVRSELARASL